MGQRQREPGPGCSCHPSRQAPHLKQREVVVQLGGRLVLGVQDGCLDSEGEAGASELVEPQHQPQLLGPVGGRIGVRAAILQPPDPPMYPEPCFQGPSRLSSRPRGPRSCPSPCPLTRPLSAWSFPCSFSTASSPPSPGSYPCCHPTPDSSSLLTRGRRCVSKNDDLQCGAALRGPPAPSRACAIPQPQ